MNIQMVPEIKTVLLWEDLLLTAFYQLYVKKNLRDKI